MPSSVGPLVQRVALRPVPDDPAGDRQPLRPQQRHAFKQQVDVLVRQQPAHRDQVDPIAVGIGVPDACQVDPVRHRRDRGAVAQDLAEPLGGLRGGGDELVGNAHREPLHQPPDPAEGAQVLLPVGRAPHLVPGDGEPLALQPGDDAEREDVKVGELVGLDHVEPEPEQPQAGEREQERLAVGPALARVHGMQAADRAEGDRALPPHGRAGPPVHRAHVNVGPLPEPLRDLVVPELLAAAKVRVDRVGDKGHHRPPAAAHLALPLLLLLSAGFLAGAAPTGQVTHRLIDSAGLASRTTT